MELKFLILCIYLFHSGILRVRAEDADLYSQLDDVLRLNTSTFIPTVFQQNKNITFMVQFYNTYCGHCQMFAPVYKELATRVRNWTSVVRLAGIDCSKEENVITCSENKIEGYPTIYIYPPNAKLKDPNDAPLNLRKLHIEWNVDDIEESIIDYLGNLTQTNRQYPLVINAFQPIKSPNLNEFVRLYNSPQEPNAIIDSTSEQQDLMFVVENNDSYLGRKLIIEYSRISDKLELRRIPLSNKLLLKAILSEGDFENLEGYQPILVKVASLNDGSKVQVLVRGEAKHILPTSPEHERQDFIERRFRMFFEHLYSIELKEKESESDVPSRKKELDKSPGSSANEVNSKEDGEVVIQYLLRTDKTGGRRLFAIDLLKGIAYMITHEIRVKGDLSSKEFETVRHLLTILDKYLPLEKWDTSLKKFIVDLRTRLDAGRHDYELNGISNVQMKDIQELAGGDTIRLRYGRENWVSCQASDKQHKGYTCSLWLLFHSLTVGEYYKAAPVQTVPRMVLSTMRGYITKFLGCTVCASNFEKETESLDDGLISRNSSILWLWYTHNKVNQRLNNEKQLDKLALTEVLFPSHKACSTCYKSNFDEIGLDGKTLDDIEWNSTSVFKYMVDLYKPDRVITPIEMASILTSIKSKSKYDVIESSKIDNTGTRRLKPSSVNRSVEEWNIQSLFSTSDISLCLFLYVASIVIVAMVCVSLNPKLKRLKTR